MWLILSSVAALVTVCVPVPIGLDGKAARAIDGDTLSFVDRDEPHVRLSGIDAPEARQSCRDARGGNWACGVDATVHLARLIEGRGVLCDEVDRDRYGRVVAVCRAEGVDLGRRMVQDGWAVAYTRYDARYAADQNRAQRDRAGMWAGSFENPETWRHRKK